MNLGKMMKDLQKMQERLQAEVETLEVEASAGGGAVTARMNGRRQLVALRLSSEAITPDDPGLMEDLILAAVNDAVRRVDAEVDRLTQGMTTGLKIPGLR